MRQLFSYRQKNWFGVAAKVVLVVGLTALIAPSARAQGQIASGIVTSSGSGPYTYNLSFTDAAGATSPIGSVWYAWVPGGFFLPATPTSASAPAGWTASIQGTSIQFVASGSSAFIAAGKTLSGFSYQASFSPSQLAAASNSGESVAYSAALFSDGGNTFTVQPGPVPEPSSMALLAVGALGLLVRRQANRILKS